MRGGAATASAQAFLRIGMGANPCWRDAKDDAREYGDEHCKAENWQRRCGVDGDVSRATKDDQQDRFCSRIGEEEPRHSTDEGEQDAFCQHCADEART